MDTDKILFVFALALTCSAQTLRPVKAVGGVSAPVFVTNAGDGSGRIYIVEQAGTIRILRDGVLVDRPFLDIRGRVLRDGSERGLLGLAFPTDYATSRVFYVNYTDRPNGNTVVARYRTTNDPEAADPASEQILLTIVQPFPNHNGGMLAFSPRDGYLYIGMGDGGSGGDPLNNGQNPQSLLGKILRIDVNRAGTRAEIWALGVRNPWRFSFDRATHDLWIGDVGQNAYEEIDYQPASSAGGENYGWRRMEGNHCFEGGCSTAGLTLPVFEYDHSLGCSVTGGYVYRGRRWAALQGWYLFGDYCSGIIWGLEGASGPAQIVARSGFSITTFGEDEQGEIYVADAGSGTIYQLFAGVPTATAAGLVSAASFSGAATPGSLASLFGTALTTVNGVATATAFPLPTTLAGTSVRLDGVRAPLLAVANVGGQEQINFQVPWELEGKAEASLIVENNGVESAGVRVPLVAVQPGLFAGTRQGQWLQLWATGLGAVLSTPASGQPGSATTVRTAVRVLVNETEARVDYAGLAPGNAGLYQVNALIPEGIPVGQIKVVLIAGGVTSNTLELGLD